MKIRSRWSPFESLTISALACALSTACIGVLMGCSSAPGKAADAPERADSSPNAFGNPDAAAGTDGAGTADAAATDAGGTVDTPAKADPCVTSCRNLADQYALLDCADSFAMATSCAAAEPFVCGSDGSIAPDPSSTLCRTQEASLQACLKNGAMPPSLGGPTLAGAMASYDGLWTGKTEKGWRVSFIVRNNAIPDLVVYTEVSGGQSSCVFALVHQPPASPSPVSGEGFQVPVSSPSRSLLLNAKYSPVVSGTFSGTQAQGELRDVVPGVVLCGGLSILSGGPGTPALWTATRQGPAPEVPSCGAYCNAVGTTNCADAGAGAPLGTPCQIDTDCGGGKCVALSNLQGVEACWAFNWSSLTCPISRKPTSNFGWKGGYCTPTCLSKADCAMGANAGECLYSVAGGYLVRDSSRGYLCSIGCDASGHCPAGLSCVNDLNCGAPASDPKIGTCVPCQTSMSSSVDPSTVNDSGAD
ncbi:MAG TPA: hypothetical protein VGY54_17785 [Polyangiaceae bacterium]|jgi:hypothetical protein|nr:hypothetical protein [Polyangiaceae bacterium]